MRVLSLTFTLATTPVFATTPKVIMPPPLKLAELPEIVVPLTVANPVFQMPPPSAVAELPDRALPVTVSVPSLKMPPPNSPGLLEIVQPLTISTAATALVMPPPRGAENSELPETVQLLMLSVPRFWIPPSVPLATVSPERPALPRSLLFSLGNEPRSGDVLTMLVALPLGRWFLWAARCLTIAMD